VKDEMAGCVAHNGELWCTDILRKPECNKHLENQGIQGLVQWEQSAVCLETKH